MMDALGHVGFYIKDAKDRIVTVNTHNCEISSFPSELDVIGKRSSDIWPTSVANACLSRDAKVRKTGKPLVCGANILPPAPTTFYIYPLRNASNRIIGTMCFFITTQQITDNLSSRKKLEPALKRISNLSLPPPSLHELAKATNLSPSHFRRIFAEHFGESPSRYAIRLRLNKARIIMEESSKPLAQVAIENGFYDQSHFIKAFRTHYKMTPSAYRLKHRSQNPRSDTAIAPSSGIRKHLSSGQ